MKISKGVDYLSGYQDHFKVNEEQKSRHAITNTSMKDLSESIKKFENLTYKGYVRMRPKHESTNSYFYLARLISKFMMRADTLNLHVDPKRTEMTETQHIPISHLCDLNERESKGIITDKKLSQVCSMDKRKLESVIFDESSMKESESEIIHKSINTNKEKYAIDETEDEKPLVTDNPVIKRDNNRQKIVASLLYGQEKIRKRYF